MEYKQWKKEQIEKTFVVLVGKSWCQYTKFAVEYVSGLMQPNNLSVIYTDKNDNEATFRLEKELCKEFKYNTTPMLFLDGNLYGGINEIWSDAQLPLESSALRGLLREMTKKERDLILE